ncbi:MAG TPA: acyloxyacyl hydrolase [Thermoanaerobaculia bacterium]
MSARRVWALGAVSVIFTLAGAPAFAADPALVTANAGQFNVFDGKKARWETSWEVSFVPRRYRWLPRFVPGLSPTVGGLATQDGSLYAYAGFRFDLPLGEKWVVVPQWAAGLYWANEGRDLGGAVEFRSGIELTRRIGERSRVGILLYHLSNASLYRFNPGTESLVLTYSTRP